MSGQQLQKQRQHHCIGQPLGLQTDRRLRAAPSINTFKICLKTFLFDSASPHCSTHLYIMAWYEMIDWLIDWSPFKALYQQHARILSRLLSEQPSLQISLSEIHYYWSWIITLQADALDDAQIAVSKQTPKALPIYIVDQKWIIFVKFFCIYRHSM